MLPLSLAGPLKQGTDKFWNSFWSILHHSPISLSENSLKQLENISSPTTHLTVLSKSLSSAWKCSLAPRSQRWQVIYYFVFQSFTSVSIWVAYFLLTNEKLNHQFLSRWWHGVMIFKTKPRRSDVIVRRGRSGGDKSEPGCTILVRPMYLPRWTSVCGKTFPTDRWKTYIERFIILYFTNQLISSDKTHILFIKFRWMTLDVRSWEEKDLLANITSFVWFQHLRHSSCFMSIDFS